MADLKDMGVTRGDIDELSDDVVNFPSIWMNSEHVERLGLQNASAGDEFILMAMVRVVSKSQFEEEGGEQRTDVTLDLREAEVGPMPATRSQAERIFGDGGE